MSTNLIVFMMTSFVFFQMKMNPAGGFIDRTGMLFFISVNTYFVNSMPLVIRFVRARTRLYLERRIGLLSCSSIIISQYLAAAPLIFIVLIPLSISLFYISNLQSGFQYYLIFGGLLILMALASMSFGLLIASAVPNVEYCQILVPFFGILFFLFANLAKNPDATWILKWFQYLSIVFYAFQGSLNGMLGNTGYLQLNGYPTFSWPACFGALAGFTVLYLIIAIIIFHFKCPSLDRRNFAQKWPQQ